MKLFKQVFAGKYRKLLIAVLTIIILSVTATPTFADVGTGINENSLIEVDQAFSRAWAKQPKEDRKKHLYEVCELEQTSMPQKICLDALETFLKFKKELIIDSCY